MREIEDYQPNPRRFPPTDEEFAQLHYLGSDPRPFPGADDQEYVNLNVRVNRRVKSVMDHFIYREEFGYDNQISRMVRHAIYSLLSSHIKRDGNWKFRSVMNVIKNADFEFFLDRQLNKPSNIINAAAEMIMEYYPRRLTHAIYEALDNLRERFGQMPESDLLGVFRQELVANPTLEAGLNLVVEDWGSSGDDELVEKAHNLKEWYTTIKDRVRKLRSSTPAPVSGFEKI